MQPKDDKDPTAQQQTTQAVAKTVGAVQTVGEYIGLATKYFLGALVIGAGFSVGAKGIDKLTQKAGQSNEGEQGGRGGRR